MKTPGSADTARGRGDNPRGSWRRLPVLLYGLLAYLFAIRSLVYFVAFASNVPLGKTVDSGQLLPWPAALAVDLALLLSFALPHSLMARTGFKRALARHLPEAAERSAYVLVAALLLTLLMWQWRPIGAVAWDVQLPSARNALLGIGFAGWGLAALSYYSIGHLELLGLRQAHRHYKGAPAARAELVTGGIYRYLRDPMYLGFAVGMWVTPRMTAGRLLLAAGMSAYVLIGMRYERRDLRAKFGERYLAYLGGRRKSTKVVSAR